ncbi:MAG: 2-oxo acid dehydrogenase subunit E2 [Polyangiaceae bacterium]
MSTAASRSVTVSALSAPERWVIDERLMTPAAGGMTERTIDVTQAGAWLDAQEARGVPWAFALLLVRAAAITLARRPDLVRTLAGYHLLEAGSVDIGLAASGTPASTSVVIAGAERMPLHALEAAIANGGSGEARPAVGGIGKWLAWIPFGFLRRLLLRWLLGTFSYRRCREGTFHLTCATGVDVMAPMRFLGGAALGAGRVREAFVAVEGRIEKRRVATLILAVDHAVMDGVRAAAVLSGIADLLEGDALADEMNRCLPSAP